MSIGRVIAIGSDPQIPSNNQRIPNVIAVNTSNSSFSFRGGQSVVFKVKNFNILGTTVTITNIRRVYREPGSFWRKILGDTYSVTEECAFLLPPLMTALVQFTIFGAEPMSWRFEIGTNSDAHIVGVTAYSTWVEGMPPNR